MVFSEGSGQQTIHINFRPWVPGIVDDGTHNHTKISCREAKTVANDGRRFFGCILCNVEKNHVCVIIIHKKSLEYYARMGIGAQYFKRIVLASVNSDFDSSNGIIRFHSNGEGRC